MIWNSSEPSGVRSSILLTTMLKTKTRPSFSLETALQHAFGQRHGDQVGLQGSASPQSRLSPRRSLPVVIEQTSG